MVKAGTPLGALRAAADVYYNYTGQAGPCFGFGSSNDGQAHAVSSASATTTAAGAAQSLVKIQPVQVAARGPAQRVPATNGPRTGSFGLAARPPQSRGVLFPAADAADARVAVPSGARARKRPDVDTTSTPDNYKKPRLVQTETMLCEQRYRTGAEIHTVSCGTQTNKLTFACDGVTMLRV